MKKILRAALAAVTLTAAPAFAGTLADVNVISRATGQRLPVYAHGGKLYVAGQPGERYSVQVANRTGARVLSVVSVDGINVVSGETASPDQTGYVLAPGQSYDIVGWRKNADEVAAFYFTALPDSYAARTDRPGNVGVIGIAVFREWVPPRPRPRIEPRPYDNSSGALRDGAGTAQRADTAEAKSATEAPAAERAQGTMQEMDRVVPAPSVRPPERQAERIGTGHGEREQSAVTFTDFRRASASPSEVLTIYYDRYENLAARGIVPGTPRIAEPRPFPAGVRFAPDPRS